ncbi:hypothetical protein [Accumulibacter sp.]|uniref:hypothetical protein n=1 Tax=Accumulibacter sp. TaxID=2053492 RepID=UPI001D8597AF|nr:hypothetical protein [Accumulibacter sp.]MCB1965281.1 hypothetical protein [Accumulibacter sp.]MCP5227332.1 hypothetical protein [Accumulibacter sp.]
MSRHSPSDVENGVASLLSDRLMDVPISRARGSARLHLDALLRAAFAHPVFPEWPTPVDGWLDEAELLADELGDSEARVHVVLRRALVRMRRLDLDGSLALLEQAVALAGDAAGELAQWCAISRVRVLLRKQRLDDAWQALRAIPLTGHGDSIVALRQLALGEYHLEANAVDAARGALSQALRQLPEELVEERIQASQSLAFVFISLVDVPRAVRHLEQARAMLRGAGVWREVVQMDVALGSLLVARAEQTQAQKLFAEAAELCREFPQPDLGILIDLGMARSNAAQQQGGEAVSACLRAAKGYAEQGNLLGLVSMVLFVAGIQTAGKAFPEAYRTLATGLAIARHRRWPAAEAVFRAHIDRLRNELLGPARFDEMVAVILQAMKA